MKPHGVAVLVLILAPGIIAGCTTVTPTASGAAPGSAPPPTVHETSGPSVRAMTPAPTVSATSATSSMTDRERSDWFWGAVTRFGHPGVLHYDSLGDISRDAHLIVRGHVTGILQGPLEMFDGSVIFTRFGLVTFDEVIKGTPQTKIDGTLLVAELIGEGIAEGDLPRGEVIMFLMNYAQERVETGSPPAADPNDRFYYSRPNSYQAVLRNLDGLVRIVDGPRGAEEGLGPFPWQVDGRPFEEVVDRIRTLSAG